MPVALRPCRPAALAAAAALALAACAGPAPPPAPAETDAATGAALAPGTDLPVLRGASAPAGAAPGSCWVRDVRPALVETVTERVALPPVSPGGPAVWQSETRQRILRERQELVFEIPCPELQDGAFLASLQRALRVRGFYTGPVTGTMDGPTAQAVRRFQQLRGLDSAVLSAEAARALGLLALPRPRG